MGSLRRLIGVSKTDAFAGGEMAVVDADNPHVLGDVRKMTEGASWFWRISASGGSGWLGIRCAITA